MRKGIGIGGAALLLAAGVYALAHAQAGQTKPSPPAKAACTFADGKTINVVYSSPRMRGRKIYADDGLVPFGQVWRAGANEATTFVPSTDVLVGDKDVPKGSYTLFVIPKKDMWVFIVSSKTGEWGIPYPGAQYDFTRTDMNVGSLPSPVEDFTIGFDQGGNTCTLNMDWETTRASVKITEKN